MKGKILFFLPTLGGGGAERTIVQLANIFAERQYNVHLAVCDITGNNGKLLPEVESKVTIIDLSCKRVLLAISPLKKLMVKENYDWICATQTHSNIIALISKKIAAVSSKLIVREVSTPSINIKLKGLKKWLFKVLVRETYKFSDFVVCVSNGVKNDFCSYYSYDKKNIFTIYDPVLDKYFLNKLTAKVQHKFFDDDKKVILAIGRLTEAKNFNLLIHSFKHLHDNYPKTRLIILGEGELRAELEKLILDLNLTAVVELPGFDPNPYAYFKYASLFVLSSNWEGLPGVLIQALASKIKIVSTNCPSGPMEILDNSKYGLLVECDNQPALSQAMEQAIFKEYVNYSDEELESHLKSFHVDSIVEEYLLLMEKQCD